MVVTNVFCTMNTYSNRRVANHLHGLIFELKERMNSRQDRPVMQMNEKEKIRNLFQAKNSALVNQMPFVWTYTKTLKVSIQVLQRAFASSQMFTLMKAKQLLASLVSTH